MKTLTALLLGLLIGTSAPRALGLEGELKDVPERHWAADSVRLIVSLGIMTAPGGMFAGDRKVTRAEMVTVLARFARLLEQRRWPDVKPERLPESAPSATWKKRPVTRYELAVAVARLGSIAMAGMQEKPPAKPQDSEAIPLPAYVEKGKYPPPVERELRYLAERRYLWSGSRLLQPDRDPVTGEEAAQGLAMVIAGVNARWTAEPQNEPVLAPRRQ